MAVVQDLNGFIVTSSTPAIYSHMADVFTPETRSEVMSRIRGRDTKPELALRSMLHRLG